MSEITCPHCRGSVPWGATVCRGCQAEIEYGTPTVATVILVGFIVFIGYQTSAVLPETMSYIGWIVGIGGFIAGRLLLSKKFINRVYFKRIYNTK